MARERTGLALTKKQQLYYLLSPLLLLLSPQLLIDLLADPPGIVFPLHSQRALVGCLVWRGCHHERQRVIRVNAPCAGHIEEQACNKSAATA